MRQCNPTNCPFIFFKRRVVNLRATSCERGRNARRWSWIMGFLSRRRVRRLFTWIKAPVGTWWHPFGFCCFILACFLFLLSVKASDVGQCLSFCVFDLGVSVLSYFQRFGFCFWTNFTDVLFVPQWGDYVTSRVRPSWWGSPEHQGGRRWYHWGRREFEIVIFYYKN